MKITPTILEKTSQDLENTLAKLSPYFDHFQIDIADGKLVPNKTASIEEISEKGNLPNNLIYDFHLMVIGYEKTIQELLTISKGITIDTIFVHSVIQANVNKLMTHYSNFRFGLAINPEENIETIGYKYNLKSIKAIQIMSVNPGFQGSPFMKETLNKIEQLRSYDYKDLIYLDGGVNEKTLPIILSSKFKPDVVCPGSYFTKAGNLEENVSLIKKLLTSTEEKA